MILQRLFLHFCVLLLNIRSITAGVLPLSSRASPATFTNTVVFKSPSNYNAPGTLYARTLELPDGSLLATWENYSPEPPPVYLPIYKSTNGGSTWSSLSQVKDQVNGWGLRYQPFMYLLPQAFGGFPQNTILLAANSIPTDLSKTQIDLYASRDSGKTWNFVSHIASGGRAVPNNGETPVWEPFLMLYGNTLVCYYSDQRDPAHGQKLVHQTSTDGKNWGSVVEDVGYANYTSRPGMTTVTQMGSGGKYVMTYEYGGGPVNGNTNGAYTFPVFYKIADNPLNFAQVQGQPIVAGSTVPVSSPYVVWDAAKSMLIVSCGTQSDVYVNHNSGAVGSWQSRTTGEGVSYSRSLRVLKSGNVLIAGGGMLPPAKGNSVTVGSVSPSSW